jgi:4-alpha-glucanotransferase
MRVLQFGFDGGDDNPHAPERISADVICYAGTHDNNTTLGWLSELTPEQRGPLQERYEVVEPEALVDAILDEALGSPAQLAVLTMQDLLKLPAQARFNTPGTVGNNWSWRVEAKQLSKALAKTLADRCLVAGRSKTALKAFDKTSYP